MKKFISVILSALILSTVLTACGGSPNSQTLAGSANGGDKDTYKIAIVQPMSHTSLDQIRDITSVAKDRKAPSGGKSRTREADDAANFA